MNADRQELFLRLISGQSWLIQPDWGFAMLDKIVASSILDIPEEAKTSIVDIYNNAGILQGSLDELDSILESSIAVVNFDGIMTSNDGWCNTGMNTIDMKLRSLYAHPNVSGIILKMTTGGGSVEASNILQNSIKDKNKPVVVYTNMLASGGIKGTLYANEIIAASDDTIVGSIGVMMVMPKWYVKAAKEDDYELYSTTSPEKNKAWRELKNGNSDEYVKSLTETDAIFMNQVKSLRNLKGSRSEIKETLSGNTFVGADAKKRGLIDGIGSFNYALKRIFSHIKYSK